MEWFQIISAFFLGAAGLYVPIRKQIISEREKRLKAENNMRLANNALKASDFRLNYAKFRQINHMLDKLVETSATERALTLTALEVNENVNTVAVIMSSPHKEGELEEEEIYEDIPIDEPYRQMLNHIKDNGSIMYKVSDMPRGMLRDIYETEGVKFSMIVWGTEIRINDTSSLWIYFSFATYTQNEFDIQLQLRIQSEKNRIVSIINSTA